MTGFIYPEDYFTPGMPDEEFAKECEIARELGFEVAFYNQETLLPKNILPEFGYIYRGWMLSPDDYKKLDNYVQNRFGIMLVSVDNYVSTHFYSEAFKRLNSLMPYTTRYLSDTPVEAIVEMVRADVNFSSGAFFVKDSIKSVKNNLDASVAENINLLGVTLNNFINEQGSFLSDEILVKDFVKLDKNTPEMRLWLSNRFNETRAVFSVHPDFKSMEPVEVDKTFWGNILNVFSEDAPKNSFITIDIAKTITGGWVIIEIGNGQVSG